MALQLSLKKLMQSFNFLSVCNYCNRDEDFLVAGNTQIYDIRRLVSKDSCRDTLMFSVIHFAL